MKILLTGCAGYLGQRVVEESRVNILGMDKLYYDQGMPKAKDGDTFIVQDIGYGRLTQFLRHSQVDAVVHLAALVGEPLCKKWPEMTRQVNVYGTEQVLGYARSKKIPFIFASTCSNYGLTSELVDEESALNPLGHYAQSKVDAEKLVRRYEKSTILRFGTLFGRSARPRLDIIPNEWVYDALAHWLIKVYSPEGYRPFLHVADAAKLVLRLVSDPVPGTFNVGCANIRKGELAELIREQLPEIKVETVTKGDDKRSYRVSFVKAEKTFGSPEQTLTDGIAEMIGLIRGTFDADSPRYRNLEGFRL